MFGVAKWKHSTIQSRIPFPHSAFREKSDTSSTAHVQTTCNCFGSGNHIFYHPLTREPMGNWQVVKYHSNERFYSRQLIGAELTSWWHKRLRKWICGRALLRLAPFISCLWVQSDAAPAAAGGPGRPHTEYEFRQLRPFRLLWFPQADSDPPRDPLRHPR